MDLPASDAKKWLNRSDSAALARRRFAQVISS
jgi:hypothetical protein